MITFCIVAALAYGAAGAMIIGLSRSVSYDGRPIGGVLKAIGAFTVAGAWHFAGMLPVYIAGDSPNAHPRMMLLWNCIMVWPTCVIGAGLLLWNGLLITCDAIESALQRRADRNSAIMAAVQIVKRYRGGDHGRA